jgi:hypothetical protein
MLLLYVFIVLLILLTLLSAFGGSIRASSPAPAVRFERFTDAEQEELEEFIASEPFRRGLYAPSPAPMMEPQIFRPMSASSPAMSMPMMSSPSMSMPMMSSPSMSMPMMSSPSMSMPMMSAPAPMMEMYEEIEKDGGAIEPFEQNDILQASY